MPTLWFLTHPEVVVDAAVPVPLWGLSDVGRARAQALSRADFLDPVTSVWSSTETKARETAALVVGQRAVAVIERADLGENDRSATGFLPSAQFEALADAFFGAPDTSVEGWERATDAQVRIVAAVADAVTDRRSGEGDVLIVGHGATGTLLLCHLLGVPITRQLDQAAGGGMVFAAEIGPAAALRPIDRGWRPLEDLL